MKIWCRSIVGIAACFAAACSGAKAPVSQPPQKVPAPDASSEADTDRSETEESIVEVPSVWKNAGQVEAACDAAADEAARHREAIVAVEGERTVANTLDVYNELMLALYNPIGVTDLVANVHPDKEVRGASEKCQQRLKKIASKLQRDPEVYAALGAVDKETLDAPAKRFLEHALRDYRREGVDKDEATRAKLAEIHEQMVEVGQEYARRIREGKKEVIFTKKELTGMPEDFLAANPPGEDGKIHLTTDYPHFFPLVTYASKESVRQKMYLAFMSRAYPENAENLKKLLDLRQQYADTLGYGSWADYMADDKMVGSAETIEEFVDKVASIARPRMERDLEDLLALKKKDVKKAKEFRVWDRFYYVNKLRADKFDVDSQEVRQYFPYEDVKQGVMRVAAKLFGVRFEKIEDENVWDEKVEAYALYDGDRKIARFYMDMHPRDGKYGHAAMFPMYMGVTGRQLPSASLVCNFPEPSKDNEALMEHNEVVTFFHEFGHLMHHLLAGEKKWSTQSGINCEWDFVEVPSQLLEHWAWEYPVLSDFAKHQKTGEPIPRALVDRMKKADELGRGVHVMRQIFYAALSLKYHNTAPAKLDLMGVLKEVQKGYSPYPFEKGTYVFANFGHLEGYSSMYYTYMWSLMLSEDIFTKFKEAGLMNEEIAMRYRENILEPGGAIDAADMVKNFLGRDYAFDAFRRYLSGVAEGSSSVSAAAPQSGRQ